MDRPYPVPGRYTKGVAEALARVRAGERLSDDDVRDTVAMSGSENVQDVFAAVPELVNLLTELVLQVRSDDERRNLVSDIKDAFR